jgi:hypothetical protein
MPVVDSSCTRRRTCRVDASSRTRGRYGGRLGRSGPQSHHIVPPSKQAHSAHSARKQNTLVHVFCWDNPATTCVRHTPQPPVRAIAILLDTWSAAS